MNGHIIIHPVIKGYESRIITALCKYGLGLKLVEGRSTTSALLFYEFDKNQIQDVVDLHTDVCQILADLDFFIHSLTIVSRGEIVATGPNFSFPKKKKSTPPPLPIDYHDKQAEDFENKTTAVNSALSEIDNIIRRGGDSIRAERAAKAAMSKAPQITTESQNSETKD